MLPPLFKIEHILQACETNELILTANQRLKSKAIEAWGHHQRTQGLSNWQAPRLMTLDQWFTLCWQQLQSQAYQPSLKIIPSSDQQRVIWESVTVNCGLMQTEELAKQASTALQTLERWQLSLDDIVSNNSNDVYDSNNLFKDWCNAFTLKMDKHNFITQEQSIAIIANAFKNKSLAHERRIHLVGFDDLPPLFNQALKHASASVKFVDLNSHEPKTRLRTQLENPETEMKMAAQWAKNIIEQNENARVAIIVPNLGQCRSLIERALINTFESHSLLPETPRYTYPFNISAGTPLIESPLIYDTLQLLKLSQKRWSLESLVQLLFSPFWGQLNKEKELRCALADKLLNTGVFEIDLSQLRYWAEKIDSRDAIIDESTDEYSQINSAEDVNSTTENKGLFHYFNRINQLRDTENYKLPSNWVAYFFQHLELLQWPGERKPDSHEYQQIQLWYKLLESLCSLDNTLGAISLSGAIKEIEKMAQHQPFQAQVPDSPIQVLGILEGAGLHFTHCWILGLEQKTWPPAPSPNVLLPLKLQRENNMPHASSLRELEFAKSLTKNYFHCADNIVFSSANYDENNEQALHPSSLISALPFVELEIQPESDLDIYRHALYKSKKYDTIECHTALAVNETDYSDEGLLNGGVNIIKAQAANPFDAFAKYRLKATTIQDAVNGFSPIEIGNILHFSMADIWLELKNQEALLSLEDDKLHELVYSICSKHINKIQKNKPGHLGYTLCELEANRQTHIILQWLNNVEKNRPPFTVEAVEESKQITLNGIKFNVRLDRVDRLNDGSFLIIDYKTGSSSIHDWLGDRPKEPQLPIYLVTHLKNSSAIAFAEINVRKQKFDGLGIGENQDNHKPINIEGICPIEKHQKIKNRLYWHEAKEQWLATLSEQLNQFLMGDTRIDYRDSTVREYNKELICLNRFYDSKRLTKLTEIVRQK